MPSNKERRYLGDEVYSLGRQYAEDANNTEFATALRDQTLPRDRFLRYVAAMYPIVIGFNRALIRSMSKVDLVLECVFVKALAEQLQQEQTHNQLWRQMLDVYGLDHGAMYRDLQQYMKRFSPAHLDQMTQDLSDALADDIENVSPGVFPQPAFPEPVLALYHQLWMTASYEDFDYWEHYASQFAIEVIICDVVSTSIFPGVVGNEALEDGPSSFEWWKEHAKQGGAELGDRSAEEKHIELAKIMMNRSQFAASISDRVLVSAERAMRLFVATMVFHNRGREPFPIDRYVRPQK